MHGAAPERPVVFMKNPASVVASGAAIVIPAICREGGEQVDYEGELAVRIGRAARDVPPNAAMDHVDGLAVANDVSARWWQKHGAGGQFVRGKSFDTFCPLSPFVPADRAADVQALRLRTWLNDDLVQDASTADMIFPVRELIAELSRGMTLLAGTIILTGTPAGVGAGRTPPRFLRDGDRVRIEIEDVGVLENPIRGSDT